MSKRTLLSFIAAITASFIIIHVALSSPGAFDPAFGGNGIVTTDINGYDVATDVALQDDGKIIVVGGNNDDGVMIRYNADGTLDTSFGSSGIVTQTLGVMYPFSSVALGNDKILVAGKADNGGDQDFVLLRYNASDGSLDTTFDGDGMVLDDVSGGSADWAYSLVLQPDGKIVVVGESGSGIAVVRYTAGGARDSSFGNNGLVSLNEDKALDVALQTDGKIVVAVKGITEFTTIRLNTNGTLDTSFDDDGIVRIDFGGAGFETAYGVAIQPDGKIVVVGSSEVNPTLFDFDMAITRLNTDGSIDSAFGTNGIVTYGSNSLDEAADVSIGAAGKIIVVGYAPSFTILQYNEDGTLDSGFGNQGVVSVPGSRGHSLTLQPDHKIVATGYANNADFDFLTVRLEGTGLPNNVYLPLVVSQ